MNQPSSNGSTTANAVVRDTPEQIEQDRQRGRALRLEKEIKAQEERDREVRRQNAERAAGVRFYAEQVATIEKTGIEMVVTALQQLARINELEVPQGATRNDWEASLAKMFPTNLRILSFDKARNWITEERLRKALRKLFLSELL